MITQESSSNQVSNSDDVTINLHYKPESIPKSHIKRRTETRIEKYEHYINNDQLRGFSIIVQKDHYFDDVDEGIERAINDFIDGERKTKLNEGSEQTSTTGKPSTKFINKINKKTIEKACELLDIRNESDIKYEICFYKKDNVQQGFAITFYNKKKSNNQNEKEFVINIHIKKNQDKSIKTGTLLNAISSITREIDYGKAEKVKNLHYKAASAYQGYNIKITNLEKLNKLGNSYVNHFENIVNTHMKNKPRQVCSFFKPDTLNSCKFGNECNFEHSKVSTATSQGK